MLIVLATVGLLGSLALSVLGSGATRSDLAVCANNLRQVGRAFHMWSSEHGGNNLWWTSVYDGGLFVPSNEGLPPNATVFIPGLGAVPLSLRNNAWFQFAPITSQLQTPRVLVCPSDPTRVRTTNFSNAAGGFFHASAQNRALSYIVGLHAVRHFPSSILSGDRSLREDYQTSGCSANVGTVSSLDLDGSPGGWLPDLHLNSGNLLLNDGHVEELSGGGLTSFLGTNNDDNGATHFLKPYP